jgi:glucose/arabinose dehydrogenase
LQWKAWDGMLAVAFLKDKQLKLIGVGEHGEQGQTTSLFKDQFGRLRAVVQGPDGNLYITTDNGTNDKIMKIIPE